MSSESSKLKTRSAAIVLAIVTVVIARLIFVDDKSRRHGPSESLAPVKARVLPDPVLVQSWALPDSATNLAIGPSGAELLAAITNNTQDVTFPEESSVLGWNLRTGKPLDSFSIDKHDHIAAYAPTGDLLAVGSSEEKVIQLLDAESKRSLFRFELPIPLVENVAFSKDGRWLACVLGTSRIGVWDIRDRTGPRMNTCDEPCSIAFGSNSDELIVIHRKAPNEIRSVKSLERIAELPRMPFQELYQAFAVSAHGDKLAMVTRTGQVGVWKLERRQLYQIFATGHPDLGELNLFQICFAANDDFIVTSGGRFIPMMRKSSDPPFERMDKHMVSDIKWFDPRNGHCLSTLPQSEPTTALLSVPSSRDVLALDLKHQLRIFRTPENK